MTKREKIIAALSPYRAEVDAIAKAHGVTVDDLIAPRARRGTGEARAALAAKLKDTYGLTYQEVGNLTLRSGQYVSGEVRRAKRSRLID